MILAEEKKKVEVELREVKAREVKAIGSAAVAIVLIPVSLAANLFKSLVGIFSPWVCTDLLCYCFGLGIRSKTRYLLSIYFLYTFVIFQIFGLIIALKLGLTMKDLEIS